jgi:hypothetical protein
MGVVWSSFMARMVRFFGSGADVAAGYTPPSQK